MASGLKRGDFVTVVMQRDYGKPRPALIQNDIYGALDSVVVCPVTTELTTYSHFRISVPPTASNGIERPSQVMIDKLSAIPVDRVGRRIGQAEAELMSAAGTALSTFLALG